MDQSSRGLFHHHQKYPYVVRGNIFSINLLTEKAGHSMVRRTEGHPWYQEARKFYRCSANLGRDCKARLVFLLMPIRK